MRKAAPTGRGSPDGSGQVESRVPNLEPCNEEYLMRKEVRMNLNLFLPSCFDSILLRPSQVGFAITEAHHYSVGVPYF